MEALKAALDVPSASTQATFGDDPPQNLKRLVVRYAIVVVAVEVRQSALLEEELRFVAARHVAATALRSVLERRLVGVLARGLEVIEIIELVARLTCAASSLLRISQALRRPRRDYPESPYVFVTERQGLMTESNVAASALYLAAGAAANASRQHVSRDHWNEW